MMFLDYIKGNWKSEVKSTEAAVDMWDAMAAQFQEYEIPGKEDLLLQIIEEEKMIDCNSLVLDLGCGTGRHSIAVSRIAKKVTGIDLSSKMIKFGNENLEKMKIKNVNLVCEDWSAISINANNYEKQFDLVYAHMTPAISDFETFQKMISSSKKHGILVKPSRRKDEISDMVMKIAGLEKDKKIKDESIAFAFGVLFLNGLNPKMKYKDEIWEISRTYEEACDMYLNRAKTYKEISNKTDEEIRDFLRTRINSEGKIEEKVNTTITAIYW